MTFFGAKTAHYKRKWKQSLLLTFLRCSLSSRSKDSANRMEMEAKPFACFPEVQPIFAVAIIVQTEWKWKQSLLLTFLRCSLSSRSKDNIFFYTEHKILKKYSKTLKKKQIRILLNVKSCIFCQKVVGLVRQSSQRVDIGSSVGFAIRPH